MIHVRHYIQNTGAKGNILCPKYNRGQRFSGRILRRSSVFVQNASVMLAVSLQTRKPFNQFSTYLLTFSLSLSHSSGPSNLIITGYKNISIVQS